MNASSISTCASTQHTDVVEVATTLLTVQPGGQSFGVLGYSSRQRMVTLYKKALARRHVQAADAVLSRVIPLLDRSERYLLWSAGVACGSAGSITC
jgi:hypothetical protein